MELRDYIRILRAHAFTIVMAALICGTAAYGVSLLQPKVYEGTAQVLISERDNGAAMLGQLLPELSSQPERGLQTQVELMRLRPLAATTISELGLNTDPERLLEKVEISAVGQTNVVKITAQAGSAAEAAAIANSLAEGFVEWSRDAKRESLTEAANSVEVRLKAAQDQILALGQKIQESGKTDQLSAELQIATGTYTTLAEKLETLRINQQLEEGSGRVVATAVVPQQPVAPLPIRNAALGVALGLVLGVGMALASEYLDNTVRSAEESEELFGAPVLGTIPMVKEAKAGSRRLVLTEAPGSGAAEAYRVLRSSLGFVNFEENIKTILVTSAAPSEGKSTVSANLAMSLAQAGHKVALVSCDFRRHTLEEFFPGVNNLVGLSHVLLGSQSLKSALQRPGDEQLLVLTAGEMPPNPSELLGSRRMAEVIESLEDWADWVIVDSPPLLAVADPAAVAQWSDGVLVVSRANQTTRDEARKAAELLGKVGAKTVGVVVWGIDENSADSGYGYGYGYGYKAYKQYAPAPAPKSGRGAVVVLAMVLFIVALAGAAWAADWYFGWGYATQLLGVIGL